MRPIGTAAELERRRRLAISHLQAEHDPADVAEFLGVTRRAVELWRAAVREHGIDGIRAKPPPPRKGKLTPARARQVLGWFRRSPRSFGFDTELWTARRVAEVIRRKWGIEFNPRYLVSWLKERGITSQKPQRRAREADPEAVARWRTHDWPRLKNGRDASGPPLS